MRGEDDVATPERVAPLPERGAPEKFRQYWAAQERRARARCSYAEELAAVRRRLAELEAVLLDRETT